MTDKDELPDDPEELLEKVEEIKEEAGVGERGELDEMADTLESVTSTVNGIQDDLEELVSDRVKMKGQMEKSDELRDRADSAMDRLGYGDEDEQ
jgi:hypothetical protein